MFQNLLVIELASVLAGPSVGQWLAELGAAVIKIEHHQQGGDVTRTWKLPQETAGDDRPAYFASVNWGKKSLGLNLRSDKGRSLLQQLAGQADIVLASYKPGDAAKLGADAETLRGLNPKLIYADITAYGPEDPRAGFDAIIQAEAGFTYMNGSPDSGPVKMPVALMDLLAAHQLREAILLALIQRGRTGEGAHVSASLIASGLASLANQASNFLVAGHIPQAIGSDHPNIVPYGTIFETKDGKPIVLAIGNDRQFGLLCEALGEAGWAADPRFQRNAERVRHRELLQALLRERIRERDRGPLLQALQAAKVPAGAVHDMQEALSMPAAAALKLSGSTMQGLRTAAITGIPMEPALSEPPHLGEHSAELLARYLGIKEEGIAELLENGDIGIYQVPS